MNFNNGIISVTCVLCYAVLTVLCSFVITSWERADILALLCVVFLVFCHMSYGVLI